MTAKVRAPPLLKRASSSQYHPHHKQAIVAQDLIAALDDSDLCDVNLIGTGAVEVPANRFVLAARSPIFRKMLYGNFREAKSASICLLGYSEQILKAIVHFCSFHELPHSFADSTDTQKVCALVQLAQAADYLQMPFLVDLAEKQVKRQMARDPSVTCTVLQEAVLGSNLSKTALLTIECRPYVTLDSGSVCCLSAEKLEIILRNSAVGAGEWFLFQMLKFWYEHHKLLDDDRGKALGDARQFCERYIRLTDIEPAKLLSAQVQQCDFVTPGGIFTAVAQQALRASQNKTWRMLGRGCRRENAERVLVEGAGSPDANGMYYRVAQGHGSDLYSKRETVCGQEYVYTLSRCLIRNDINNETVAPYYECRIFCSKFLTHNSVRSLQIMQSTNTINPFFQPVMQVLEVTPPFNDITTTTTASSCCFINNNLSSVPSPIRKYYRVRLSDGEHFMPGTLSRELSVLVEGGDLQENHVIQILEFGLYTMDGSGIGIHIIKAAVVTTATEHCFGDPVPLTESSSDVDASLQQGDQATLKGLQNMYQCRYPAADGNRRRGENAIPQTGWQVDSHGVSPAPICTWIPAIEKDDSTDNASITSAMTMPVSS